MISNATIYAWATPPGRSGVAILRISGSHALDCLSALSGKASDRFVPRMATRVALSHPSRHATAIDDALALVFPAPASFTGEDVVELHTHGSPAVYAALLEALGSIDGCRMAEPGEFTQRAFLNGKLDLLQAEGIADLIDAETPAQHAQALEQLEGTMSLFTESCRQQLIRAMALTEAYLDFPDEPVPDSVMNEVEATIDQLKTALTNQLDDARRGELIRDGMIVVIIGRPNVGKSSLLNYLADRDVAIVSEIAGTTRDRIEVDLNIAGYKVRCIDTAGIHESADTIEREGIERAKQAAKDAQICIMLEDATQLIQDEYEPLSAFNNRQQVMVCINKVDRLNAQQLTILQENPLYQNACFISVTEQTGLDILLETLHRNIVAYMKISADPLSSPAITRARHRQQYLATLDALRQWHPEMPIECQAEELRLAASALGKITGQIDVDTLLDVVFKEFCIGK